jgi:signal transduction histidine kinase
VEDILLLLLLAVIVPSICVAFGLNYYWYEARQAGEVRADLEAARSLAAVLEEYVDQISFREDSVNAAFESAKSPQKLQNLLETDTGATPAVRDMFLVDSGGIIVVTAGKAEAGANVAGAEFFLMALGSKQVIVTDLLPDQSSQSPIFVVARSYLDSQGRQWVVATVVDTQRLGEISPQLGNARQDGLVIFDSKGHEVYGFASHPLSWQERLAPEPPGLLASALAKKEAGGTIRPAGENADWLVARVPVPRLGWAAGAGHPKRLVVASVKNRLLIADSVELLAVAASILVALMLRRRVIRGITDLRWNAAAIGRGEWDMKPDASGIMEIGELKEAMALMAARRKEAEARLQESERSLLRARDELDQKVKERTAQLAEANLGLLHKTTKLRKLASELIQAEQQERRRVANILHEDLQQLLVGVRFTIGAGMVAASDEGRQDACHQADDLLGQAIEASRSLTLELRPPVLYELGLARAMEWLANRLREKNGMNVKVKADQAAEPKTDDLRIFAFDAVRELLANVAKHAQTTEADVVLERVDDGHTRVVVKDQGAGFDSAAQGGAKGFGLFSIRERAECLGGRLDVQSQPALGTQVTLTLPIQ